MDQKTKEKETREAINLLNKEFNNIDYTKYPWKNYILLAIQVNIANMIYRKNAISNKYDESGELLNAHKVHIAINTIAYKTTEKKYKTNLREMLIQLYELDKSMPNVETIDSMMQLEVDELSTTLLAILLEIVAKELFTLSILSSEEGKELLGLSNVS